MLKLADFTDGISIDYTQLLNHAFTFSVGAFVGAYLRQLGMRRQARRESRHASSLATPGRTISIVTTAALPWRTGTSVNPLLRAAHLANDAHRKVLLVVPWLEPEEQELLYPKGMVFQTKEEQAEYILSEGRKRTALPCKFKVLFWDGKYFAPLGSIFPISDITAVIPQHDADVAILEEPEHLNWFQHTTRWTDKFNHVVGIMHTNYLAYVRGGKRRTTGVVNAAACSRINKWVCRIHCHKVIKLSNAVQNLPRQVTCNVHGVGGGFIDIGRAKAKAPEPRFTKGAYFIGKAVWGKGYHELISLMASHQQQTGESVPLDVYGSGEDLAAIKAEAQAYGVNITFHDGRDHADEELQEYQLFINPCTSDVVATTTAEALASGKWVIVEDLPCNTFFAQFPNCLMYTDAAEFSEKLEQALATEPARMDDETLGKLSWEAATERLLEVSEIKASEWPTPAEEQYASTLWTLYRSVVGFKALREALGIDTVTDEEPVMEDGEQFDPTEVDWLFQ